MEITLSNRQKNCPLSLPSIKARLRAMLKRLDCPAQTELSVLLVDDEEIARLNETWLGHVGPTNVLSFSQQEGDMAIPGNHLLGDVVVSVDTARREAMDNGLEADEHLMRLILHGILHLLGYHHEEDPQAAREMEALTEEVLAATCPAPE